MSRPNTASEMTKKQIDEYKEAFKMFDKDGDKKISVSELGEVMRMLGMDPTKQELKDMIDNADIDGSKHLEFDEFLALMIKRAPNDEGGRMEEMRHAFRVFDKNGDNFISRSELKSAMRKMGEKMSDRDIDVMIKEADLDKDGRVNYQEFVRIASKR